MILKHSIQYAKQLVACGVLLAMGSGVAVAQHYPAPSPYAGGQPWDVRRQYYEQLPDSRMGGEPQSPLDRFLGQAVAQTWFQMDYVQWSLDEPGNRYVGARIPGVPRPDQGYTIIDSSTGAPAVDLDGSELLNYTPNLNKIDLGDRNGLRMTYGLDTNYGTLEANVMWIFKDTVSFDPGPPFPHRSTEALVNPWEGAVSIPFSVDGTPATRAVVFTGDSAVHYNTGIFGTEANFVFDDRRPENGFHFRPIIGFRYLNMDEKMGIWGTSDSDPQSTDPPGDAYFESKTRNQVFGPQLGFKTELRDDYFTIGARSMFTLGFNRLDAVVAGDSPTSPFAELDAPIVNALTKNLFSPVISLQLYTEIRLMQNCKLFGGYDILFLESVSRAYETIDYNVNSQGSQGFGVNSKNSTMFNHGFTVGLLFDF